MVSKITSFLLPNKPKLIVFILLGIIFIAGGIQSWAFTPHDTPKPLGYDTLNHFPFTLAWPISTMILAPLLVISIPLMDKGVDVTDFTTWYGVIIISGYLYFIASACVTGFNFIFSKKENS